MRKFLSIILVLSLLLSVCCVFAGCGSTEEEEVSEELPVVLIAGNEKETSFNEFEKTIFALFRDNMSETVGFKTEIRESLIVNLRSVAAGETDITVTQGDILSYATKGENYFSGGKLDLKAICSCYYQVCQLIVPSGSGIQSVNDLAGKTVVFGEEGSTSSLTGEHILAGYGLSEDSVNIEYMGFEKALEAIQEGSIDAFMFVGGAPVTSVMKLAITDGIRLIPIEGDGAQAVIDAHDFYAPVTVAAETYSGQSEDITTLAVKTAIVVKPDMDEELVYQMTKMIFENLEPLTEAYARSSDLSAETALEALGAELHPGAARYYKEIGVLKE